MGELPGWVSIFERLGPSTAILVFFGSLLWQLLPASKRLLAAWAEQARTITKIIPSGLRALESIAHSAESLASRDSYCDAGSEVRHLRRDRHDTDSSPEHAGSEAV